MLENMICCGIDFCKIIVQLLIYRDKNLTKRRLILIVSNIHLEFISNTVWLVGISFRSWQELLAVAVSSYGIKSAD